MKTNMKIVLTISAVSFALAMAGASILAVAGLLNGAAIYLTVRTDMLTRPERRTNRRSSRDTRDRTPRQ